MGCGSKEQEKKAAPPVPVVVTTAIQKTVPIITEFTARADAKDTVELRARVEAFLDGIHFEEGRPVKKGQVLFTLDKRKYEADLQTAKAQLAKAKADLEFAKDKVTVDMARAKVDQAKAQLGKADLDVNRLTPLAKEKAVPQQDLDNALVAQQVARSNVDASQASYETVVLNQKVSIDQARGSRPGRRGRGQERGTRSELLHDHGPHGRVDRPAAGFCREPGRPGRTDLAGHDFGPGSSSSVFRLERGGISDGGQTDGRVGQETAFRLI